MKYLVDSGSDPEELIQAWSEMVQIELADDHPAVAAMCTIPGASSSSSLASTSAGARKFDLLEVMEDVLGRTVLALLVGAGPGGPATGCWQTVHVGCVAF